MTVYEKMTALADAIREKTGGTEKLSIDQMTADVAALQIGGGSEEEWFNDGNTHLWVHLEEGRTSPMLGIGVNGTVTVDWGDGTTPDVLTGTSVDTTKYTPNHEYASAGDYVITLTVDGEARFTGNTTNGTYILVDSETANASTNKVYRAALEKAEIGDGVSFGDAPFHNCFSLSSVKLPDGLISISNSMFGYCYPLKSVNIPDGVTSMLGKAFYCCSSLSSVKLPDGLTSIDGDMFNSCYSLRTVNIPDGVTNINSQAFYNCASLSSVKLPDGLIFIGDSAFRSCSSLSSVKLPGGLTSIASGAFRQCYSVRYFDFSKHTAVPALSSNSVFTSIPADCEIRVPTALYDEWIAATNWTSLASQIVAV